MWSRHLEEASQINFNRRRYLIHSEGDSDTMAIEKGLHVSLPDEINLATRSLHIELNRLITSRLPLALPPYSPDPTLYRTGLLHFAHVYLTFESLWNDLIPPSSPGATSPPLSPLLSFLLVNPYSEPDLFTSSPSAHILEFLQTLRPKGLPRSARLKRDLEYLTGLHPTDFDVLLSQYPGDQVAEFCTHIRRQVAKKPHVLVAYAWCFYMAIFSGGRWIRGELLKAGPEFWSESPDSNKSEKPTTLQDKSLSFWCFPGEHDGLDIKEAFRARLQSAEALFTIEERVDIVEEAKIIFKLSANLVHELDAQIGTDMEKLKLMAAPGKHHKGEEMVVVTGAKPRASSLGTWMRRPEVTGTVLALGCLACVAFFKSGY